MYIVRNAGSRGARLAADTQGRNVFVCDPNIQKLVFSRSLVYTCSCMVTSGYPGDKGKAEQVHG